MNTAIIPGSITAVAQQQGKSIAETFVSADAIVIVDVSGSMEMTDSKGGKSRYAVACEELASLQALMPGKLAVIAFSDAVKFCPAGIPPMMGGGTDLTKALKFCKVADTPGMNFIVISDGEPGDEASALQTARTYRNPISVIYVGPEERPAGRQFLQALAAATGGSSVTIDRAKELKAGVEKLLLRG